MGQKTNPIGNRLGIIRGWESNWYGGNDYGDKLAEDDKIRKYIFVRLAKASVSRVIIERTLKLVTITITTARPGIIIGKGGQEVDKLKEELRKLTGEQNCGTLQKVQSHLNTSISDSEESTTEISPLLTTYEPDAIVQGLLQRTTEREIRTDRNRMCEILLLVIFFALVLFLYLLEEGWLTSMTYPMNETFLKLILVFSLIIILLILEVTKEVTEEL